jgi:hypothetical protein
VWGDCRREGVEPRATQGAVMSGGAKDPFYRPAWIAEAVALAGGQPPVVFNSTGFEE